MSDEPSTLNRRTVLTTAGATLGTAALGSAAYGGTQWMAGQAVETEWEQFFGGEYNASGEGIAQAENGAFGVLSSNIGDGQDGVVTFSATGERQWTAGLESSAWTTTIEPARDGGYIVGGLMRTENSGIVGILVKLSQAGEIVWRQRYQSRDDEEITIRDIVQRPDSGYAFVANEHINERGGLLFEVTEDGATRTKTLMEPRTDRYQEAKQNEDTLTYSRLYGLTRTAADGYVLAGTVHYDYRTSEGWAQRVDESLSVQWDYTSTGSNFDIVQLDDARFVVVEGEEEYNYGFTTLSTTGEVVADDRYFDHRAYATHIVRRDNGELTLLGDCQIDCDDSILLGAAPNGTKQWSKRYDPAYTFETLIATADGGIALVGAHDTGETTDSGDTIQEVYVAKLGDTPQASPTATETATPTETETETATSTAQATDTATETDGDRSGDDCEI